MRDGLNQPTQPLDEEQRRELDQTPIEQHQSKIREMKRDVSPWHELSDSERINFISNWKRKWLWEREMDSLIKEKFLLAVFPGKLQD